ncbi:Leucine-rich repeat protein kinase family protein [Rhynchospora pubera]|uniref:Leucine-rich repeat protein kinase family protein n=1 Tax=Rhynchospora pubera TaxID=906938 RepID=A0AAV8EHG0_9POAL|nr:Leucine-rich repeat protein kinase family protein [Rhynchospora pubera]
MLKLQVLNLSGNHLNAHVPEALMKKNNSGILLLLVDSCTNCEGHSKRSPSTIIIIVVAAVVVMVLAVIMGLLFLRMLDRRRRRGGSVEQETQIHSELKIFTHEELKAITNNFSRTIGKGGFGIVYHGHLENQTEVAVKVCSLEPNQANKQFLAEVKSLSLVHHKNLVTLVGYCKDGVNLAVVYEFLHRGSLFDHLRGKDSCSALDWKMRLNIVLEAAQALDYLHTGCGMVHRDVKSSNILLGQNFEAKISDLGLSRMFSADVNSVISLSGTPGYMDPEYQLTFTLNEKSDVYSFGVILMEIVTGDPPILNARERIHIVKLVKQLLSKGSIEDVVDSRFEGEYDTNAVWKVVELAMVCTRDESANRPTMADVVVHLKDCVQIEEHRKRGKLEPSEKSDLNSGSISTSQSPSVSFAPVSR